MHLLLTDRLSCPRCGPRFGLILRADRMADRRVREGLLGCPNCRDRFPVSEGFADLRAPPRGALPAGLAGAPERAADGAARWPEASADVERIRALLGLVRGPGTVLLVGEPARWAGALAAAVSDLDVVGLDADLSAWPDAPGVSRGVSSPGLAFFSGMGRGVVVDARAGRALVDDAARVLAPRCRMVLHGADEARAEDLAATGLDLVLVERGTVVAARE